MKFNNSVAALGTLGMILLFFISESSAAGCTQYGHSCWGGHGKRGIPDDKAQQLQRLEENWFIAKLARSARRGSPLPDLAMLLNRPTSLSAKEIEAIRQYGEARESFDNDRRDFVRANSIATDEEKPVNEESIDDLLFLTDNSATPEKVNLMKLLNNNISSQK